MYGYKLKINCIPEIVWACETTVTDYHWKNRHSEDMLEISVSTYKEKTVIYNNTKFNLKKGNLSCIIGNEDVECYCEKGAAISILSVAVKFKNINFSRGEITENDLSDNSVLLLPAFYSEINISNELEIVKILHNIIKFSSDNSENEKAAFISEFFKLLQKIDNTTRSIFTDKPNNYYIKKTDYIIEKRYSEKITLQQIATELNISPVYLSSIYKATTGINFSDKLLTERMKNAEKLLSDQHIPTHKIAELCGFCDESYFRKKFKSYFGMNVKEYRSIKNGITLYHDKPVRDNFKN